MARQRRLRPPDAPYLNALRSEMETAYQVQDEQIDRLRELRQMSRAVPVPPDLRFVDIEIRDPTIGDEIQRIVATLVNQPPRLSVKPSSVGVQSADENATEREHFTSEVLRIAGRLRDGPPTITKLADAVAGDGGGCTKFVFRPDIWDERYSLRLEGYDTSVPADSEEAKEVLENDRPEGKTPKKGTRAQSNSGSTLSPREYQSESEGAKKRAGPPFAWSAVDIRTVYPVFQAGRIEEVIEVSERPVSSTFRRYRLAYDAEHNICPQELAEPSVQQEALVRSGVGTLTESIPPSSCTFIEHWDDTWVTYYVCGRNRNNEATGQVVDQWKHGYGRHPYFFTMGFMPAWWSNRKVGWSISETKRWLVEFRSYLWTIYAQQMARDTMPPVSVEIPETAMPVRGRDGTPKTNEKYRLGEQYFGQPGEKRVPWVFANTTQSLKDMIGLVTDMINQLGTPRMEQNIGSVEASGFAINQILAEARLRFDPLAKAIERTLEDITRFMWHLIRTKIGETVWVYSTSESSGWKGMGPKDLKGDVRIEWKLDPTLPSAALVESRYWVEQVQAGFASMDQAIEAQGRNPDEVRFQQTLDRLRQTEWYQKLQEQFVTAAVGRGDLLSQAFQAQQLAATGQLPGASPGAPPQAPQNPNAVAAGAPVPAGMNTPGLPDPAGLQIAPNQEGARGVQGHPGPVPGAPQVPLASAAGGAVQPLR